MKLRFAVALALGSAIIISAAGCCGDCWRRRREQSTTTVPPPNLPPPGYQTVPPRGAEILQPTAVPPGNTAPMLPPTSSGYTPAPDGTWIPAPQPQLPANPYTTKEPPLAQVKPAPQVSERPPEPVRLLPPELTEKAPPNPAPPASIRGLDGLPAGIPSFVPIDDKLSTGLKPDLEGLDWLQSKGYRLVLHLRKPGATDSTEKEQIEKRGMKYRSLEIAPEKLDTKLVDQFNKLVADADNLPLFVYDNTGLFSGVMWYMHFRTADKMSDDRALERASQFGLRKTGSDEVVAFWIAIQKYFEVKK
ncbi:MAG TPA: hypothetical protein VKS79_25420 [Gemmataceae bacterium]|nr:hypothetical protein [Gemmataceae bacterium]